MGEGQSRKEEDGEKECLEDGAGCDLSLNVGLGYSELDERLALSK
jgi:hypothetical protein